MEHLNHNLEEHIEHITKYFRDSIPEHVRDNIQLEGKYEDKDFPADLSSITANTELNLQMQEELLVDSIEWRRYSDVYSDFDIFLDKIEANDIKQGGLSICYFLSSLAALTEFPDLIFQIFRTKNANANAYYEVALFIDGEWQVIPLDDYFPFKKGTNKPAYTNTNSNEIWILLLEKAWAKVNGGYANIILGHVSDPLQALTSFAVQSFALDKYSSNEIWQIIKSSDDVSYVMCTGSKNEQIVENMGLVKGHAYCLVSAKEKEYFGDNLRLLKLYNPWGSHEWTGAWSDNSETWNDELKEHFKYENADDGTFFIDCNVNYQAYFSSLYIGHLLHGAVATSFLINKDYSLKPIVFRLDVEDYSKVSLSVHFKHWRFNRDLKDVNHPFSLVIAEINDNGEVVKLGGEYSIQHNLEFVDQLAKGKYLIWLYCISTDEKIKDSFTYSFRAICQNHYKIEYAGEDENFALINDIMLNHYMYTHKEEVKALTTFMFVNSDVLNKAGLFSKLAINRGKDDKKFKIVLRKEETAKFFNQEIYNNPTFLIPTNVDYAIISAKNDEKTDSVNFNTKIITAKGNNDVINLQPNNVIPYFLSMVNPNGYDVITPDRYKYKDADEIKIVPKFRKLGEIQEQLFNDIEEIKSINEFVYEKLSKYHDLGILRSAPGEGFKNIYDFSLNVDDILQMVGFNKDNKTYELNSTKFDEWCAKVASQYGIINIKRLKQNCFNIFTQPVSFMYDLYTVMGEIMELKNVECLREDVKDFIAKSMLDYDFHPKSANYGYVYFWKKNDAIYEELVNTIGPQTSNSYGFILLLEPIIQFLVNYYQNEKNKTTWVMKQLHKGQYIGQTFKKESTNIGALIYENGDIYVGRWKNGKMDGRGKLYSYVEENQRYKIVYDGDFYFGFKHGTGRLCMLGTGERFEGDFLYDNIDGMGILIHTQYSYIGQFRNGKKNGVLLMTDLINNKTFLTYFVNDKLEVQKVHTEFINYERQQYIYRNEKSSSFDELAMVIRDGKLDTVYQMENHVEILRKKILKLRHIDQFMLDLMLEFGEINPECDIDQVDISDSIVMLCFSVDRQVTIVKNNNTNAYALEFKLGTTTHYQYNFNSDYKLLFIEDLKSNRIVKVCSDNGNQILFTDGDRIIFTKPYNVTVRGILSKDFKLNGDCAFSDWHSPKLNEMNVYGDDEEDQPLDTLETKSKEEHLKMLFNEATKNTYQKITYEEFLRLPYIECYNSKIDNFKIDTNLQNNLKLVYSDFGMIEKTGHSIEIGHPFYSSYYKDNNTEMKNNQVSVLPYFEQYNNNNYTCGRKDGFAYVKNNKKSWFGKTVYKGTNTTKGFGIMVDENELCELVYLNNNECIYKSFVVGFKNEITGLNKKDEIFSKYSDIEQLAEISDANDYYYLYWDTKYMINGLYIGQLDYNRQCHGKGLIIFNNLDKGVYVGDWRGNSMHGEGKHYIDNQLYYAGEYHLNEKHGKGKYYFNNNIILSGTFDSKGNGNGSFNSHEFSYSGDIHFFLPTSGVYSNDGDEISQDSLLMMINSYKPANIPNDITAVISEAKYMIDVIKSYRKEENTIKDGSIIRLTHKETKNNLWSATSNEYRQSVVCNIMKDSGSLWRVNTNSTSSIKSGDVVTLTHVDTGKTLYVETSRRDECKGEVSCTNKERSGDTSDQWKIGIFNLDSTFKINVPVKFSNPAVGFSLKSKSETEVTTNKQKVFADYQISADDFWYVSEIIE